MIPYPSPAHGPAACPACPSQGPLSFLFKLRVTSSLVISALSQGPWKPGLPAPTLFLIYSFQQGASLPYIQGLWEWWPAYPTPKAKNTKYLLSLSIFAPPQLPAVASVYIEISYWPCHPQSTPFSPRYSRAATCLSLLQWYRPGLKSPLFRVVVSPKLQVLRAETPKGFPDLLAILVLEVCALPNLADARTPTPPGPALTPGLKHRPFHPAPPRHGLTPLWARPSEPSCHAFLASASPVPSTHPRSRRGYPIRWARQSLSIFRCCCRNKDDLNLSQACFENAQSP